VEKGGEGSSFRGIFPLTKFGLQKGDGKSTQLFRGGGGGRERGVNWNKRPEKGKGRRMEVTSFRQKGVDTRKQKRIKGGKQRKWFCPTPLARTRERVSGQTTLLALRCGKDLKCVKGKEGRERGVAHSSPGKGGARRLVSTRRTGGRTRTSRS